jgi:hypothetical protein
MNKNKPFSALVYFIYFLFTMMSAHATSEPLLTFLPLTPTKISISNNGNAVVQYIVTNQSAKTHTLMMMPIKGITQITSAGTCSNPFVLTSKKSCTLTLNVSGTQIPDHITGGPKICQQGPNGKPSPLQCYQPSVANILNITLKGPQIPTLYSGMQNGAIYYSITEGITWSLASPPAGGSAVNSVVATSTILFAGAVNGTVYSSFNNGTTWASIVTPAPGFAVNNVYVASNNKLYIASAKGTVFICALNGTNCVSTTAPVAGFAVNGVFATTNALYAASANGSVYYSNNNGRTWVAINGQPDSSAVKAVYVAGNTLYVSTANEYVYRSTSLTGGGTWIPYAQTVYSLFVNTNGSAVIAGTQGGYVFSLSTGNELGFITYSPINSVYLFG